MYELTITPVVTEKSTLASQENGQYHFHVPARANKIEIKKQLEQMYGTKVESVRIINTRAKKRFIGRRNEMVKRAPGKKAIVTFKGKEHIDLNKIK